MRLPVLDLLLCHWSIPFFRSARFTVTAVSYFKNLPIIAVSTERGESLTPKHFIAFYQLVVSPWGSDTNNRKYSFGRPGRSIKFWALVKGAYSRRALVRG